MPFYRKATLLLLTPALLLLNSCAEYRVITIQTLMPSEVVIPPTFTNPLVVVSLTPPLSADREDMAQAALDSTLAIEAALVFIENLMLSPWFSDFDIPVAISYRNDGSRYILPFSWDKVNELREPYNADLVISIDYARLRHDTKAYNYSSGLSLMYYGELRIEYFTYWRIYEPIGRKILDARMVKDTLVWQQSDFHPVRAGHQLPGYFSTAAYAGFMSGQEYAYTIAPSWDDENRLLYRTGSKEMRRAAALAKDNLWLDAAALWRNIIENPEAKPMVAARAAFNMALANEMSGNFDVALEWLNKSREIYNVPEREWYRGMLNNRIEELSRMIGEE